LEDITKGDAIQIIIPGNLSEKRYISGISALNLPAPEGTSGDWHFYNHFFRYKKERSAVIAGEGETVNTNHIYGTFGIYDCADALGKRHLVHEGQEVPYAANHFRAILDLIYEDLKDEKYPSYMQSATEEFLNTEEQKALLIEKAALMSPHLSIKSQTLLSQWIAKEKLPDAGRNFK
jgi:hypothetical protein